MCQLWRRPLALSPTPAPGVRLYFSLGGGGGGGLQSAPIFQAGTAPVLGGAEPESILGRGNGARQPGRAFLSLRAWLTVRRISHDSVPDVGRCTCSSRTGGIAPEHTRLSVAPMDPQWRAPRRLGASPAQHGPLLAPRPQHGPLLPYLATRHGQLSYPPSFSPTLPNSNTHHLFCYFAVCKALFTSPLIGPSQ